MKRWLAAILAVAMLMSLLPAGAMAAQYATVKGGWLRLRSQPSFDAPTLASYYTGTVVEIYGTSGDWYRVNADGNIGYMLGKYLTLVTFGDDSTGIPATVISSNGYGVRLRMGPGTNYRVIRKFDVGTPATILQRGQYWCKISIQGYTGFMMSQFLTTGSGGNAGGSVTYVGDATIWSSNGYGVRLRTGPGKQYSKIGVYSVGTQVKIIQKGELWDYIQVGSRRGYMMNEFLIYNSNYTVTGVSINNANPCVGNVLAVQNVTPATATVTYEWLVTPEGGSETVKGTSAAYLVTEADVGATIRLKVTGAGSYSGTAYSAATAKVVQTGVVQAVALSTMDPYVGNVLTATVTPASAKVKYFWTVGDVQKSNATSYTVEEADIGKTITLTVEGEYPFSGLCSVTSNPVCKLEAPQITTETLPAAVYQTEYQQQLTASGGGSMVWSLTHGSLPAGLSLSQDGVISGIPAETGSKTFTVKVTNGVGEGASKELTLTVHKATISLLTIEGVDAPVKDALAAVATAANDQYVGTVSWNPAPVDDHFAAGTEYTASISLVANAHYTFTGLTANAFSVPGSTSVSCTVGADGTTAVVMAVFPATESNEAVQLNTPAITGIRQQTDGQWVIEWTEVANANGYMLHIPGMADDDWYSCNANFYLLDATPANGTYQVYAVGDGVQFTNSDTAVYVYSAPVDDPTQEPSDDPVQDPGNNPTDEPVDDPTQEPTDDPVQDPGNDPTDEPVDDPTQEPSGDPAPEPVQLAAPKRPEVVQQDGQWKLQWEAVDNAIGYRFRQTNGANQWEDVKEPFYLLTDVPQDGAVYQVYAVGDGTAWTDSEIAELVYTAPQPDPVQLDTPTGLSIQENGGIWTATWNAVANASGYRFRLADGSWQEVSGTVYTFAEEPVTATYAVCAVGDGEACTDSEVASYAYTAPEKQMNGDSVLDASEPAPVDEEAEF